MTRRTYTEAERKSNEFKIVLTSFTALGLGALASLLTGSGLANFIGYGLLVAAFSAAFWWLFASESAQPLQFDDGAYANVEGDVEMGKKIVKILKKHP